MFLPILFLSSSTTMLSFLFLSFPSAFSSFPLPLSLHFPSLVSPLLPPFSFTPSLFYLSAPSLFFSCVFFSFFLPFFFYSLIITQEPPQQTIIARKKKSSPSCRGPQPGAPGACWGRCRPARSLCEWESGLTSGPAAMAIFDRRRLHLPAPLGRRQRRRDSSAAGGKAAARGGPGRGGGGTGGDGPRRRSGAGGGGAGPCRRWTRRIGADKPKMRIKRERPAGALLK